MPRAESTDILVVGAGPAGIAAATTAAESGAKVILIDDNPSPGGQIWRGRARPRSLAYRWIERLLFTSVRRLFATTILATPQPGTLLAQFTSRAVELSYQKIILATGARERFLPFPGWTSPRVFGAGGLQALVKSGMPIANKSVLVAGAGPLLLAVAAALRKYGARIPLIAEQTPRARLTAFVRHLVFHDPAKLAQGVALRSRLLGVPYRADTWPTRAEDRDSTLHVTLRTPAGPIEIPCDFLACGYFLVPNLELAALLGCRLNADGVTVDDEQRTSLPNVFAVGESTGIGGLEKSIIEGQIAGLIAANRPDAARKLFRARHKSHHFATALRTAFALRDELKQLPSPDTLVCRCEDVPHAQLAAYATSRDAKLQTRCGMGPCQGRICGPACQFLFNWPADPPPRPPLYPTALETLA